MKDKKKIEAKPAEVEIEVEGENEEYLEQYLKYIIKKMGLKFFVKDGGTVNIHIDKFMSGVPKDPPPY